MDPEAPLGEKRRGTRRWRWMLLGLSVFLIVLFPASNLALSSPWGCRWIARKIEIRTGLEARVGAVEWSPWKGVTLRSLELLQPPPLRVAVPEPVLKISEVNLTPVWQAWLRGRPDIQSIALDTPRIVLPVELVSHFARSSPPAVPAPVPPNVPASPPPPVVVQPGLTAPPPAPTAPEVAKQPPPIPPKGPSQPTGWVHLKDASLTVVHAGSKRQILDLTNVTGSIPIAGDSAQSNLHFGKISAGGIEIAPQLDASLDWTPPRLALKPLDIEIFGYACKFAGQVGKLSNLPIAIEAQLSRQPLKTIRLPWDGEVSAASIAANGRFYGLLFAPATWQGELVAESIAPMIRIAEQEAKFDRGSSITVLRGGALSCVDARLMGDELSLLGNATILADGRLAGAARVVAPPITVGAIANRVFPSVLGGRPVTPLATPQREGFDLEALGNISQIFLKLGKDGPVVNLTR